MGCGNSTPCRDHGAQISTDNIPLGGQLQVGGNGTQHSMAEGYRQAARPDMSGGSTSGKMMIVHHGNGGILPATSEREPAADSGTNPRGATTGGFATVFPIGGELGSASVKDDEDLARLREKCSQFRVLIIGKANAGKTTILQKMCNTTENPIIRDQDGNVIDQSIIQPTDGRGIHDIDNELTFSSNRDFVFHDSAGFEAASVTEIENVRQFIAKRAASNELKYQLHAIWYCLPLDSDRPLCDAEMSFFEHGTGKAPVIAIFTKFDGMILKEYNRLRFEEEYSKKEAMEKAPDHADKVFQESKFYLKRLYGVPHPPSRAIRLQDMHKPENNCAELSKQTLEALDSKILQLLFVSVQQNNLGLSSEYATREYMLPALSGAVENLATPSNIAEMAKHMMACYRHMVRLKCNKVLLQCTQDYYPYIQSFG